MAKSYDNPTPPGGPKKPPAPANPRMAEAQRKAQAMAKGPQASPQQFFEEAWVELKNVLAEPRCPDQVHHSGSGPGRRRRRLGRRPRRATDRRHHQLAHLQRRALTS